MAGPAIGAALLTKTAGRAVATGASVVAAAAGVGCYLMTGDAIVHLIKKL